MPKIKSSVGECNDTRNSNGEGLFTWTKHLVGGPLRANFAMVALNDGLYLFGGYTQEPSRSVSQHVDVFFYKTNWNQWIEVDRAVSEDVPCGRYGHTVVAHGKSVYLWGGNSDHTIDNSVYCFDTETRYWKKINVGGVRRPALRDGHTACVIADKMVIFGGFNHLLNKLTNSVAVLDLQTFQWNLEQPLGLTPVPRDFHSVVVVEQKMYVFGGRKINALSSDQEMHCNELFCLDTANMTWENPISAINSPLPRRSHGMFYYKNCIYIFGGFNSQVGRHLNDLHCFTFTDNTWSIVRTTGELPCCRRRFGIEILGSEVYIVGGISGNCVKEKDLNIGSEEYESMEKREMIDVHVLQLEPSLRDLSLRVAANLKFAGKVPYTIRRDIGFYKGQGKLPCLGGIWDK